MRPRRKISPLIYGLIISAVGAALYKILVERHLEQTSALFIGLPTLLAILLVYFVKPRTVFGLTMFTMTLVILITAIFFGEGIVCILMAAPVLYFVAAIIGLIAEWITRRRNKRSTMLVLIPFVAMSFEGVTPRLSLPRENVVKVEAIVLGVPESFRHKLSEPFHFGKDLPTFLRLGFPLPTASMSQGLEAGTRKTVHFAGGEGNPGDLTAVITGGGIDWTECEFVSDTSHIAHWLAWKSARIEWTPVNDHQVRVRWTVTYQRSLDPAWYFGPMERYGVRLALEYLVQGFQDSRNTTGNAI
jgi:hypothetical protein